MQVCKKWDQSAIVTKRIALYKISVSLILRVQKSKRPSRQISTIMQDGKLGKDRIFIQQLISTPKPLSATLTILKHTLTEDLPMIVLEK